MRDLLRYVKQHIITIDKMVLLLCTFFIGVLIWYNYDSSLDQMIAAEDSMSRKFFYRYSIFFAAFIVPYLLYIVIRGRNYFASPLFLVLILLAPAMFSMKMVMNTDLQLTNSQEWNEYWNQIIYWPARTLLITIVLLFLWKFSYRNDNFFGATTRVQGVVKKGWWKPYLLMLLMMIPLIAIASTQHDFLQTYPKLKQVEEIISKQPNGWFYRFLFELSYGTDFITVELFFRGFLVLGFIKLVGKDCILPMACFYCTIHFGKPVGECISSYFGGILLGIIVFNTRSIYGGLMAHLGIAWLMELGGVIGGQLK